MNLLRFAVFLLFFAALGHASVEKPEDRFTIEQLKSRAITVQLFNETKEKIADLTKDLEKAKAAGDKKEEDDIDDVLDIVEYVGKWLEGALEPNATATVIFSANSYCDRILVALDDPVVGEDLPPFKEALDNVIVKGLFGHPMQNLSPRAQEKPLGKKADKECANLWSPGRSSFYSVEELSTMTPLQVAGLDVDPENATWYDKATFSKISGNRIAGFEGFLTNGMTEALRKDKDLKKKESYDLHAARKVLFMEEVYLSATSPKCNVEDAYGVEWKLKWGDEAAVEPVACRLYLIAGAKMTDMTFTNGFGPDDMVLVLMDPEDAAEKKAKEDERYPATLEQLKSHLEEFYKFNIDPYVFSQGTITKDNVDSILKNLPKNGKKKYEKDKLIGRKWVSFRESNVELKTKGFVRRLDGSRLSDIVAMNDRAVRGSYLFDMWIGNRDVKDDNNKAFFIKSKNDKGKMKLSEYHEGHHDLGLSLGSLMSSGEVNAIKTGRDFAYRGLFGKLRFPIATVFRPYSWDVATWADTKWMADKLVKIPDTQIRNAVSASNWPDFVQEALVWKLKNRRDRIGELFGDPPSEVATAPSMTVPLSTPEEIRAAERKYGLPAGTLAPVAKGSEVVLKNGQIADCKDSTLIRELVKYRYPSGLFSRYERKGSKSPDCLE